MTVAELRDYLNGFGSKYDNVEVVVSGSDHSYYRARAQVVDAEYCKGHLYEFFTKEEMSSGSRRVNVLVVK